MDLSEPSLPQQEIRRRLAALVMPAGRPGPDKKLDLRIADLCDYTGLTRKELVLLSRGDLEFTGQSQLRTSRFLQAHQRGELVKTVAANGRTVLVWGKPAGASGAPGMGIEIGPQGPRLRRMPPA